MQFKRYQRWMGGFLLSCLSYFLTTTGTPIEASQGLGGPTHIGTFEGSTTFTTSSSNGINPGLYLEVMDRYGNYTEYTSEDGVITLPDTEEGAYITQAKLLGKTMYRDQDTGELLDTWEEGRNLQLESVKMPVLTTSNYKNLASDIFIDYGYINDSTIDNQKKWLNSDFISIKPNVSYTTRSQGATNDGVFAIAFYDEDKTFISKKVSNSAISPTNAKFVRINVRKSDALNITEEEKNDTILYLEKTTEVLPFESHKSNILSTSEDVELRGIGDVQDELNLLTGEVTERIGEIVLDGSLTYTKTAVFPPGTDTSIYSRFYIENIPNYNSLQIVADNFRVDNYNYIGERIECGSNGRAGIMILKSRLATDDADGLKMYLSSNPITVQYQLATESIKTVDLSNTYNFQPAMNREVRVEGTALPLICSVTVPTETLSFVINPNEKDVDQQFIAPEFEIVNEAPASIQVTLKEFEQVGSVFRDVLPEAHEDWSALTKEQSKDLALALNPMPSANWVSLVDESRYVANSQNVLIGEVKPKSSVRFTFSAKHGLAFTEQLNSQYRLSFIFDF